MPADPVAERAASRRACIPRPRPPSYAPPLRPTPALIHAHAFSPTHPVPSFSALWLDLRGPAALCLLPSFAACDRALRYTCCDAPPLLPAFASSPAENPLPPRFIFSVATPAPRHACAPQPPPQSDCICCCSSHMCDIGPSPASALPAYAIILDRRPFLRCAHAVHTNTVSHNPRRPPSLEVRGGHSRCSHARATTHLELGGHPHLTQISRLCARAAIDVSADRRRRRRRRLKGLRTRGLEGSRARGCSDEPVMPHGSRRQSSGAEAAEARGTRPAEARCLGNGQSDRESTGARQSRRQRHRRQRACCARSKSFDACSDPSLPHLLLSSPLSLSLSLECRDSVVPCY